MSSIREVAKLAGVSVGSVSRYLNGQKLKDSNMKKISDAIKQLDYKENIIAKGLKNNQSFAIGLLMDSISSRFGAEVVSSIEKIVEANGYSLLLSGYNGDPLLIDRKIDYLLAHAVDGLIVFVSDEDWQGMGNLEKLTIPVVSINSPNQMENVDAVSSNDRESVAQVIEHIARLGHESLGVIAAPQNDYVASERLSGVYQAVKKYPSLRVETFFGDYSRLSGYEGAKRLIEKGCTALFVTNFNMSVGALELMNQKGIKIGQDILFSHFDYSDEINLNIPSRVIIRPATREIGVACAETLLKRMTLKEKLPQQKIIVKNKIVGLNQ